MAEPVRPRVYIAGPEVFRMDAVAIAQTQRSLCERYGFEPLHPFDNSLNGFPDIYETGALIWEANLRQIDRCDVVVANCNVFRGLCVDDGTAYEIGYAYAQHKAVYGYMSDGATMLQRFMREPVRRERDGRWFDADGYAAEGFGMRINLMLECSIRESGGRIVVGDFEACLQKLREDID